MQFDGSKTISEIDIFTVQNDYNAPVEPTEAMTFSSFGLTSYEVQYWTGAAWATISGGSVSGNNKVWRKFTFTPLTTTKIRVLASASPDNYSRLAEIEAWTGPSPAPRYNLALGATATASSNWTGWPANSAVNGDRKSLNAGTEGGWVDAAPAHSFPDWLQVDFGASKTIDEIDVFTLQNNYAGSVEPTESMTFTQWGLTGYEVQYWNGSVWITVPGGSVSGNNKIWRKFTFAPVSTSKIRVLTNSSVDGYSRITEVEAYAPQASVCASIARLDPLNVTGGGGENPLSQNFNWNLPLVSLPGRAGMDLGLTLSYNSLVWTKNDTYISFDEDNGFPSPGFRLGFPVIQPLYYNHETGKHAFLLLGPDGSRTELRQVSTAAPHNLLFEAADSSHLLLDASNMTLFTTDGTQLTYELLGNQFNCRQIKDRNGNYLTIEYVAGRLDKVIDTVGRQIRFNYDGVGLLTSITQLWNQGPSQVEHQWARFAYTDTTIQTNFPHLPVYGPTNNTNIRMLSRVTLADDSRYEFSYTSWGQVWKISSLAADSSLLNYRAYNLPGSPLLASSPQVDCPRFTERHDWVRYWNGDVEGTPAAIEEGVTAYSGPVSDTWTMPGESQAVSGKRTQITLPDGTVNRIYFLELAGAPRWRRGLPALVETSSGGTWQRKVKTVWTQNNESVDYLLNPRVLETTVYDAAGNQARTRVAYQQFTFANTTSCWLPRDVFEYAADATTILRTTRTNYNTSASYTGRRILGLVSEKLLYEGDVGAINPPLVSQVQFVYDESGALQSTAAPAVQHANPNFVTGRANLTMVKRYNVNNLTEFTTTGSKYNTTGAVISTKDAANHEVLITYADSFSDNIARNTFAYPTTVTDPDGHSSTTKYNFDFGAVTSRRTPSPNVNTPGPEQAYTFDSFGRLQQITNLVNNAYTRFTYAADALRVDTYTTIQEAQGEAHSFRITDGGGRVIATATDHPGSDGGFSGQRIIYDAMGRVFRTSNPTETSANGTPFQWNTAGDDASTGWLYTQQTYDWKGRPLRTTNPDGTYKEASYTGCGCAGGEVVTLTDEGTINSGVEKRRQQKIYLDVLGRTVKTEILNWSGGSVYSSIVNIYNVRDQLTETIQYAGPAGSGTFQTTTMTYDGYGRLSSRHVPEQNPGTATVWTYNADDTVNTIADAQGASQTFTYNNRHLTTSITYSAPAGIAIPSPVTFTYDAAGNRSTMTDGFGSKTYQYDLLSQIVRESRELPVGTFAIDYSYNLAGQVIGVTDPFGASFSYTRNAQGQLKAVTGSPYAGTTAYVTNVDYRAWGAPKSVAYVGSSSTIAFNSRMQPIEFRLTANGTGASIMREDYTYFNDASLNTLTDLDDTPGTNPPVTLRFLSRRYTYDHLGRPTGGQGTSAQAVPYSQAYSYDEFGNLTSSSGSYYNYSNSGPAHNTATYTNNRRSGWSYNADGQVTTTRASSTDRPRTMTYDAAGRLITSVEMGASNTVTYSAGYDGDGRLVHEATNTSPGASNASFILRSTVLGDVLTRLDQSGNKKITHVPAEGLLFATQRVSGAPGPFVSMVHRNPLGISETSKAVYDPLGNYLPFQPHGDPRPPAGSYNSGSMSALSANQADPHSFGVGCIMDGLPRNCNRVLQAVASGQAKEFHILGPALTPELMRLRMSLTLIDAKIDTSTSPEPGEKPTIIEYPGGHFVLYASQIWGMYVFAPGFQEIFEQNPTDKERVSKDNEQILRTDFEQLLRREDGDCLTFGRRLLLNAAINTQRPLYDADFITDPVKIFDEVANQGGIVLDPAMRGGGAAEGSLGKDDKLQATMLFKSIPWGGLSFVRGEGVFHESAHFAPASGVFSDRELSWAGYQALYTMGDTVPPPPSNLKDDGAYSEYFHFQLIFRACNPYQRRK